MRKVSTECLSNSSSHSGSKGPGFSPSQFAKEAVLLITALNCCAEVIGFLMGVIASRSRELIFPVVRPHLGRDIDLEERGGVMRGPRDQVLFMCG